MCIWHRPQRGPPLAILRKMQGTGPKGGHNLPREGWEGGEQSIARHSNKARIGCSPPCTPSPGEVGLAPTPTKMLQVNGYTGPQGHDNGDNARWDGTKYFPCLIGCSQTCLGRYVAANATRHCVGTTCQDVTGPPSLPNFQRKVSSAYR